LKKPQKRQTKVAPAYSRKSDEEPTNADILTARVADGIAVTTLGSATRIYFDEEMGGAHGAAAFDWPVSDSP
jgi:hypothetical protein